jgi:antitoxin YefM
LTSLYKILYNLLMTGIISISDARSKLPTLVDEVGEGLSRFLITVNSEPKAVLIGVEELESLEETAEIMAIPGAYEAIMKGKKEAEKGEGISWSEFKKKYNIK